MAVQGCAFVTSLHCPVVPTLENYVNVHPTLTAVKIQVTLEMYVLKLKNGKYLNSVLFF